MTRWEPLEPLAPGACITAGYLDDLMESHPDADVALQAIADLLPRQLVHDVEHLDMSYSRPIENTYGWSVRPFTMLELMVALERSDVAHRSPYEDYRRELLPLLEAQEWFSPDAVNLVAKLQAWEEENE